MLLDNKIHGKVITELKKSLGPSSKFTVLSGMFSIYGYAALKKELANITDIRLLLSKWDDASLHAIAGIPHETRLKNQLDQSHIAKECVTWVKKNTFAKAMTGEMVFPPQNMFHINNTDDAFVVHGASHFTAAGLGEVKSDGFEINTGVSDKETTKQLLQWFETIWNDDKAAQDIKGELLAHLEYLASEKPANLVYFITLYNIFKDYLGDINEDSIIRSKTGFKDTLAWNKLYKFQRDGVMGAIDKLEKYNGCIIADSVGLGKTFEALAVIKYYELRNDKVLVLSPKKLRDNWTVYTINDKRNLLAADRFNYDVINHTDLSRDKGKSGEINLESINWGNYDLLVIDESHNFRNNGTKTDGATRYQRLMDQIIKSGVKTKVLMLSATPVNSRMNDLKNQVAFITEGRDTALVDSGINSIEQTLRIAQTSFNKWLKLSNEERTAEALLEKLNFDYFKLLDLITIARSRKHIEKYYDVSEIGKFPERLKPMNIKSDIDTSAQFPPLEDVNMTIKNLNLAAYSPLKYLRMDKKEGYSRKYDQEVRGGKSIFRQVDRETNIVHLMRINLFKRMESSINSFALTVDKIQSKISDLLEKIDTHENNEIEWLTITDIEEDDPELEDYLIGNKVKVLIQDIDLVRWRQDLAEDLALIKSLLTDAVAVEPELDAKLLELKKIIKDKTNNPINPGNKKLVIFTAFSDTAEYLYKHISSWATEELSLHSALITGQARGCTIKGLDKNFNNLLTHFSPISKERDKIDPDATTEIDILIATDCISEGQNLQDSDMLVNYDIHWNPVRIIQRFGRVDRLGSHNATIQLVNFWPNIELDEYINLEARVSGRMVLLDISASGEENVIVHAKGKEMNDLDYRRRQMKQLQTSVIDLEDMDGSVSITDMTLNDFRMDLSGYMTENIAQLEKSPSGFYAAIKRPESEFVAGTIFCFKDIHGKVDFNASYALAPYYIVYVAENGDVVYNHLQGKKSLDIFKKLCAMNKELDSKSIEALNEQTKNGKDMSAYQHMLECAMQSIVGKSEEKGVESLFVPGGTVLTKDTFSGIEDFEVVSYLIIKDVKA